MANSKLTACMKDINRQLSGDPCCLPTAQTTVKNLTAPLSDTDCRFWLGLDQRDFRQDVNLFVSPDALNPNPDDPRNESGTTISSGLVDVGVRTKVPMLVDSICIVMRGELDLSGMDGNLIGDMTHVLDALTAGTDVPTSQNRISDLGLPSGVRRYAAQLDINRCCLRAARYFMEAFQVSVMCPTSPNVHEMVRQRLVEIGNCCFGPRPDGFGANLRGYLQDIRRANERMHLLATRGTFPTPATSARFDMELTGVATQDMADPLYGFFRSFNCEEARDLLTGTIAETPVQQLSAIEGAGSLAVPGASKWLRFRKPFVLDKDDNIDIKLSVDPTEEMFRSLALQQLCYQPPISQIKLSGQALTPAQLAAVLDSTDGTYTAHILDLMARVPTGTLRFGILLKGVMLDCNVCSDVKKMFTDMSFEDFAKTPAGVGRLTGPQRFAMSCGQNLEDVIEPSCGCGG